MVPETLLPKLRAQVIFSEPLEVFHWCRRNPTLQMTLPLGTVCFHIIESLKELHQTKPRGSNPYEGQCYIASATLKKFFGRSLSLYRTKDHTGQYHWWIETKDGKVIDLTGMQYKLRGLPVPSIGEAARFKQKQSYLSYSSYKKRVAELQALVEKKLQAVA